MATESPAILYEHADGRRAVVSANRVATFAIDNPDWHRAGPVEIVWVDETAPAWRPIETGPGDGGRVALLRRPCGAIRKAHEGHQSDVPLYTHPSPPEGMVGGWQDIATAPKDGTYLLLWEQYSTNPFVGCWAFDSWRVSHEHVDAEGGWDGAIVVDSISQDRITHWMKLPESPYGKN